MLKAYRPLRKVSSTSVLVLLTILLSACGSGGGGGGSRYSVTLSPSSAVFQAERNGALPELQTITADFNGDGIIVGYPPDVSLPTWLEIVNLTGNSRPLKVRLSVNTTNLNAGTYSTILRFLTGNLAGTEGNYADLPVTYTVTDSLSTGTTQLDFAAVIGGLSAPATQTLNMSSNKPWTATVDANWLSISKESGTGSAAINVDANSAGLSIGNYTGHITVTDSGGDQVVVDVNLAVTPLSLSISNSNFAFNAVNGAPIASKNLSITTNADLVATWVATSSANWLTLNGSSGTATGNTTDSLAVGVDAATPSLASGNYSATINASVTIGSETLTGTINVSLNLTTAAFSLNPTSISFSGVNGSEMGSQSFSIALNTGASKYAWSASISADDGSGGSWLQSSLISGEVSGGESQSPTLTINASKLSSGDYSGSITVTSHINSDTISTVLPVQLTLTPASIALSSSSLSFDGINGVDLGSQQVLVSLNTGNNAFPWTASVSADNGSSGNWLVADNLSGSLSSSDTSINLSTDTTDMTGDIYAGTLTITATVHGDTLVKDLPVTLNLEPHRLFVPDNGVALAAFPTATSSLVKAVTVTENGGVSTTWDAMSDQSWLDVTSSGTTDGNLSLTANTNGLSTDTIHYATVTVSSTDPTIENTEAIKVGLWVSSIDPNSSDVITGTAYTHVTPDPVRPYAYVHDGGTDIYVYNVFTGTLVTTISSGGGPLGEMEASSDGNTLFVADHGNSDIVPVDLATQTAGTAWAQKTSLNHLVYIRPNGFPMLIADGGNAWDPGTGTVIIPISARYYNSFSASLYGNRLCGINSGVSPYTIYCYDTRYTYLNGGSLSFTSSGSFSMYSPSVGSNGKDVALNADGSRIYAAAGAPYSFVEFDGNTHEYIQSMPGAPYPNNIEIGPNGLIYGGSSSWYGPLDVWVYNTAGALQYSGYASGYVKEILDRELVVSGDGSRVILLTDDPSLQFITTR